MIEEISGRCPSAPLPGSFSEEKGQQEVVEAFNTWPVRSLFSEETQSVLDEVTRIRPAMVQELFRSRCTQKQPFGQLTLKVRFDARCGVETLIYKLLQKAAYKSVYAVVYCSEALGSSQSNPVHAYAKSNFLHEDRENLERLKEKATRCHNDQADPFERADLERAIETFRDQVASSEQQFQTEAQVASALAPFSVSVQLVYKRSSPKTIKGLKMEYAFGGDLFGYLAYEGSRLPIPLLVRIASRVCSLVAKTHQEGFFHGDIKPNNVLLRKKPKGTVPLSTLALCDFSSATKLPLDKPRAKTAATFPSPEVFWADEERLADPVFEEDLWALGVTVFGIIYGMKLMVDWNDFFHAKHIPWNWEEILTYICFSRNEVYPDVNRVIGDLMRTEPYKRISAEAAAERLEEIAKKTLR